MADSPIVAYYFWQYGKRYTCEYNTLAEAMLGAYDDLEHGNASFAAIIDVDGTEYSDGAAIRPWLNEHKPGWDDSPVAPMPPRFRTFRGETWELVWWTAGKEMR